MDGVEVLEQEAPDIDVDTLTDEELDQQFASALQPDLEGSEPSTELSENADEGNPVEVEDVKPKLGSDELLKKVEGLEKLSDRRQTELGELRKLNEQLLARFAEQDKAKIKDASEEVDYFADPGKATKAAVRKELQDMQAQKQIEQLQAEQLRRSREEVVGRVIPDWRDNLDEVGNVMSEAFKDLPQIQQYVEQFKKNPFTETPENVIAFSLAAKYKKERDAMKTAMEERGLKTADLISKVNKYSSKKLVGNSATPSKAKEVALSDDDIDNMTDDELAKQLKELGIKT